MTHREFLTLLVENGIDFVVIGGVALRLYNSPRVTHDIDIAARTLDLDTIISLMYSHSYYLVTDIHEKTVFIALNSEEAELWVEQTKAGSISFILPYNTPKHPTVPMENIDISSQVDVLFELGIPITRLKKHARLIQLQNVSFRVASIEDLITLKEQRSDKSPVDEEDIRYLKSIKGR
jgi:hypothetical protein